MAIHGIEMSSPAFAGHLADFNSNCQDRDRVPWPTFYTVVEAAQCKWITRLKRFILSTFHNQNFDLRLKLFVGVSFSGKGDQMFIDALRMDNATEGFNVRTSWSPQKLDQWWLDQVGWPSLKVQLHLFEHSHYQDLQQRQQSPQHQHQQQQFHLALPASLNHDYIRWSLKTQPQLNIPLHQVSSPLATEIPRRIFMVWNADGLETAPLCIQKSAAIWRYLNPHYRLGFFSERKARISVFRLEGPTVFKAYDQLVPVTYRSDMWRAIILYWMGGVYFDARLWPLLPLDSFLPHQGGLLVDDLIKNNILFGFIALPPRDPLMRCSIDRIVSQVQARYYGKSVLDVTGPALVGRCLQTIQSEHGRRKPRYTFLQADKVATTVKYLGEPVVIVHNGQYRRMASILGHSSHYGTLWRRGMVYGEWPPLEDLPACWDISSFMVLLVMLLICSSWVGGCLTLLFQMKRLLKERLSKSSKYERHTFKMNAIKAKNVIHD